MKPPGCNLRAATLWVAGLLAWPMTLTANLSGYLHIPDIPGESQRAEHEDEIDIFGLEWRVEVPAAEAGSTRTQSRAEIGALHVRKFLDASSPYLALSSMQGVTLPSLTLTLARDSGDTHLDYLTITLTNVRVVSYHVAGKQDDVRPFEEVGFQFEKIHYRYVEQADDGAAGDEHEIEYDVSSGA